MGLIKEFREFIAKGNAMDLAVGVIIGAAFGKIVSSLVDDVITPALLTPALKAANLEKIQELKTDGGILYGNFLAAVLSFLIISFVIFLLIKVINTMKKKEEPASSANAGAIGYVPRNVDDGISFVRSIIARELTSCVGDSTIADYSDANGRPRDLKPESDIDVWRDDNTKTRYNFTYWYNLRYGIKRLAGLYSCDENVFGGSN